MIYARKPCNFLSETTERVGFIGNSQPMQITLQAFEAATSIARGITKLMRILAYCPHGQCKSPVQSVARRV